MRPVANRKTLERGSRGSNPLSSAKKFMKNQHTVYVVYDEARDQYYGSSGWRGLVSLEDAKIFSKKNTASACSNRWKKCKVVPCTLTVHHDKAE